MNLPRWGILLIDLGTCLLSLALANLLRFNFDLDQIEYRFLYAGVPVLMGLRLLSFLAYKTYSGIIFQTSIEDAQRLFLAISTSSALLGLLNFVSFYFTTDYVLPFSILLIDFFVSVFLLTSYRAMVKILYLELRNHNKDKRRVAIYGADSAGVVTKQTLDRDRGTNYQVIAFFDNDATLRKKRLLGVPIYPARQLGRFLMSSQPDVLVISTIDLSPPQKQEIAEQCLQHKVKVLHVPPMDKWINGELSFRQIRELRIEDLLQRDTIKLDVEKIRAQLRGKTILVTGAAGSIGSEIARQVIQFEPQRLILLDQAETPLHNLELEFRAIFRFENYTTVIGDVRDAKRMQQIFSDYRPDLVYHAAAYKHVPLMEKHPQEALRTNLLGTQTLADLAVQYDCQRFVFVSTDKAVNPTSIMGASKRLAEIYVQSLDRQLRRGSQRTQFITTRFGNVLGSNGSVIPLFKKQIAKGGPVTVTHPEMSRYFMTIPEACQLVLEAGAMGKGGEIFVFDMGQSIKIVDLARKMIRLSGLEVDQDISIVYTGLRPGEKLYEELLNDAEQSIGTHHPKIMIARVREYDHALVRRASADILQLIDTDSTEAVVLALKRLIPEFKSNNSVFERLDE
ncbi:MAG: nucleoside-diphosphate sugar epimerase/dehydratase [Bacteroidota bacterium]